MIEFPGSQLVTAIFGYWPSFHDAEVKWLRLDRADPDWGAGPSIEFLIHCFEMTSEVSPQGFYVLRKHTLVHFRFREVSELNLDGFNHQNAIFGLSITDVSGSQWERRPWLKVVLDPAFGLGGSLHCYQAEVLSAAPCTDRGEPIES